MYLIVDSTCICYIAKFARMGLKFGTQDTGVIFSFMGYILRYAKVFKSNRFIFTWDSRRSYRAEIFPAYKGLRKSKERTHEQLDYDRVCHRQFHEIRRKVLPALGFENNFIQTGLEADDIMASVALNNKEKDMVLITDDKDLYQVIRPNCPIFTPRTKRMYIYEDFKEEYKVEPEQYADILEIAGCPTDEVPGIDKVGPITASKYLRGELNPRYRNFKRIESIGGKIVRNRNRILVRLPFSGHDGLPPCDVFNITENETLRIEDFVSVFQQYGFASFLKHSKMKEWRECLKLV